MSILRPAIVSFIGLSAITGLAYPLIVTGIAQMAMPRQANGSLIPDKDRVLGSELIGQPFTDPSYFWGRPSATVAADGKPLPYNASNSNGSNLGPINPDLRRTVEQRIAALRACDPGNAEAVPVDLVTSSASGLDPHISPSAADYQVHRIAVLRHLSEAQVRDLVASQVEGPQLGIFGGARVNVLKLNLALDKLAP